ncbi:hypothetical protein C8245_21435 [Paracidovorax avenae]|uniref:hypothetical protein n=1 Tax=Paracidovorax avenae TaxID=80867 RepID=UPI000D227C3C|nr:hypothetical protein [Paracidovorax avenae]AVS67890.1 hypothetical protein C8245_21435 [Paracidovorax avenae]
MSADTTDNIRMFPGAEVPEQTLNVVREPFGYCAHDKISLNEHSRTVLCAKCNKVFDPFDFLKNEVHRIQRAWDDHRQVRQKVSEGLERVEALKREEARLKGRIKTAKAKVEPVIDVRNRSL